ncbi:MAG: KilA-N domain-containing protein, partial [Dysgonamonadaceae bacterium]|nr:KilA-N domain-containing protein [Dysgonamonadaceae bacterium]
KNDEDLIVSKQKSGTWMHEILALKFAAWLDPDFEVWVYLTIRDILFGAYKEDEQTLKTIAGIQDKITEKEKELQNLPILKEIEVLHKDEQREKRKFEQRKKMRISGFRTIFSDKEMEGREENSTQNI